MRRDDTDGAGDLGEQADRDTEIGRRAGVDALRNVQPERPRERGEAVYGETDIDPNREDQVSAHHADEDEHL